MFYIESYSRDGERLSIINSKTLEMTNITIDELFDMINHGIERAGDIEKKIHSKEKEVKYFKSIIDKNMK